MTATMSAARKALNVALRIVELTVVRPFERKGCRSGSPPSHHAGSPGPLAACAPHALLTAKTLLRKPRPRLLHCSACGGIYRDAAVTRTTTR